MKKIKLFTLCMFALSLVFVGCKSTDPVVDPDPIVEDGFYISGDATSFAKVDVQGQLTAAPVENDNTSARVEIGRAHV